MAKRTRTPTVYSAKTVNAIIQLFAKDDNWHNLDAAAGNLGYGWYHYSVIRNLKPDRVLVIGSKFGFVPAVCALACRENGSGHVDFVDAGYGCGRHDSDSWGGVGYWETPQGKRAFRPLGISGYISTYVMRTDEYRRRFPDRTWQYIYIDGDHSYTGARTDFRLFYPSLTPGGIIAFHDINAVHDDGNRYGVAEFWDELMLRGIGAIRLDGKYGLGVFQKPRDSLRSIAGHAAVAWLRRHGMRFR